MPLKLIRGSASAQKGQRAPRAVQPSEVPTVYVQQQLPPFPNVRETKASQFVTPVGLRMYLSRTAAGTLAGHVLPAGLFHAAHHHRHTSLLPTAEYHIERGDG